MASADAVKAEYESRSKINESDASPNGHHFYSSGTADIFRGEFNEKSAPNPKTYLYLLQLINHNNLKNIRILDNHGIF